VLCGTILLNLKCRHTGKHIPPKGPVNVFDNRGSFVGWGWFEFEPDLRRFWFREDIRRLFPRGMDSYVLENIFDYTFELPEERL